MSTPSKIEARSHLLACLADLELAMEGAALTVWERELIHANTLVCRLVAQQEAMIEKRVTELTMQVAAAADASAGNELDRQCEQWQRELRQIPRLLADGYETMRTLKWPTRPFAPAGITPEELVAPLPSWIGGTPA